MKTESDDVAFGREVISSEVRALQNLNAHLDAGFQRAVDLLFECKGRVVVTGIGKAGIIGQKISATLASTGTPSHFLHPVEAIHGDLGRIVTDDIILALSNSGATEVVELLPAVKRIGARVVAVTGNPDSALARHADLILDIGRIEEACPLGLAPSASTTAMLAMGDALALAVARRRNFDKEQYALYHPGGELGRKLLKVDEVMRGLDQCPRVAADTTVTEALRLTSSVPGRAGAVCVIDDDGRLAGIFTDGDLRRHLVEDTALAFLQRPISDVMISSPKTVTAGSLAEEAAGILETFKIDELPVVDDAGRVCGMVDVQDLLAVRLIAP